MRVEWRKQRDGSLREEWYGRYEINGKHFVLNLGIKIAGTPPESKSLRDEGDGAYERSRATARAKLETIVEEAKSKRNSTQLIERLYEIKTGESLESIKLVDIKEQWLKIPRNRPAQSRYAGECQATLGRFVEWFNEKHSKVHEMGQVTRTMAREYLDDVSKSEVTPRTWNGTLKLLRSTFRHLLPPGCLNPFDNMPTRTMDTVFRKPFSAEELKAILDVAQDDDFIRPILVLGSCTAMRRGDCCLLKWSNVDMKRRFITVKTAKTGQTVSIPIFPLLFDELTARAKADGKKLNAEGYVFPEQAKLYQVHPDGITRRVKHVLMVALRGGIDAVENENGQDAPKVSPEEMRRLAHAYIAKLRDSAKTRRLRQVFEIYAGGATLPAAAVTAGVSRGSASNYLNQIEKAIKCPVVRARDGDQALQSFRKMDDGLLGAKRKSGLRRASVRDFHSFRVTWVTLALTAGVPLELVQKVTGHKTTDIVLKHYFQPGREAFREALQTAMPKLLTTGKTTVEKTSEDELWEIIEKMSAPTWEADRARLLKLRTRL